MLWIGTIKKKNLKKVLRVKQEKKKFRKCLLKLMICMANNKLQKRDIMN